MKQLLYIDLFCGAGGTSTGVELARLHGEKCARVIACVNHDENAIASHAANHPETLHFTEDIRTLDITPLAERAHKELAADPDAKLVLWASLECTNFSKAKGGLPRDPDSRTLAEHLFRYIERLAPDYIYIENVREFMSWGDLDEKGKPVSYDKGRCYMKWVNQVCKYGYSYDHRLLNSANFGAITSRERLFIIFSRKGLPTAWPVATHSKNGGSDLFGSLKKWRACRPAINLEDEGTSIFDRKKPLVRRSLLRILKGLEKHIAHGKTDFILKYNSMGKSGAYQTPGTDEPCPTVAVQNRLGIVKVHFLSKQFGGTPEGKSISIEQPAGTVTTKDHHAFITAYYGNGYQTASLRGPAPTLLAKDKLSLVQVFLDMKYRTGTAKSLDEPAGTITAVPKHNLIQCVRDRFLLNPHFNSAGSSIEVPCFTLIARMDKRPPYLVTAEYGSAIAIYEDDDEVTKQIKVFMAYHGITDIKMRMLRVPELLTIQGFPKNYILYGTQAEQKKFIGNAVEVTTSRVLCEALAEAINAN